MNGIQISLSLNSFLDSCPSSLVTDNFKVSSMVFDFYWFHSFQDFYAKAGIDVPFNRPRSSPLNERQVSQHRPATPQRNSVSPESHSHKSNGSSSRKYKLRQYLEHDGHVLRY